MLWCGNVLVSCGYHRSIPHSLHSFTPYTYSRSAKPKIDNESATADEMFVLPTAPGSGIDLLHYAMGQWAVQYLLEHADSSPVPPVQHTIPCRLVERDSA